MKRRSSSDVALAALLTLGAASVAWGDPRTQARPSGAKPAVKALIGRWVIDPKRSSVVPGDDSPAAKEMVRLSHLDFLPGGRYKDYPGGIEMPGRYEVSGSRVKLVADGWPGAKPQIAVYDAKAGALTFSPGPHRVVLVRAPTPGANVADALAKALIGRWVIDPKRSILVPAYAKASADEREIVRLSHLDFLPGRRYKDYPAGVEFPGRYEVSRSKIKLFGDEPYTSKNSPPNVAEYDAKAETLTFSSGKGRVVYVRAPTPRASVADRSAKALIGRWVIDLKRMAPSPVYATPDGRKALRESYLEFLPGGRYIDGLIRLSGRYEVSGSKVKLMMDLTQGSAEAPPGSVKVEPDFGEYDAKAGTLTFSPGPRRVVYVRAPKTHPGG